jgi:hypothetical protein
MNKNLFIKLLNIILMEEFQYTVKAKSIMPF